MRPLHEMTGFEMMQQFVGGQTFGAGIGATMGFTGGEAVAPGRMVFTGTPSRAHYNPIGTVHGGWAATLLDSVMACAVHSALPAGKTYTTITLEVKYLKALKDGMPVRAEGWVIQLGGRQATAAGELRGEDGVLYAHGTTTCLIIGRDAG